MRRLLENKVRRAYHQKKGKKATVIEQDQILIQEGSIPGGQADICLGTIQEEGVGDLVIIGGLCQSKRERLTSVYFRSSGGSQQFKRLRSPVAEGFEMLNDLRGSFPQLQSLLMDQQTWEDH